MTREALTELNMELISYVGSAKSSFLEAIDEALAGNLAEAESLVEAGRADFITGHGFHSQLLAASYEEDVNIDFLTIHAQCQLMSAEDFMTIAQRVITACKQK